MYWYNSKRISCYKDFKQMKSKKTLELVQEILYSPKFYIKVEYTE